MENETKHTEGEWEVTPMGNVIHVESGRVICSTQSNFKEDMENAKLIASAPELLELLKEVHRLLPKLDATIDALSYMALKAWHKRTEKAIDKATK